MKFQSINDKENSKKKKLQMNVRGKIKNLRARDFQFKKVVENKIKKDVFFFTFLIIRLSERHSALDRLIFE